MADDRHTYGKELRCFYIPLHYPLVIGPRMTICMPVSRATIRLK